jgi:hypothetical protein
MSVLALSALTAGFDYRYLASVIGILGAAAVLGAASFARAVRPAGPRGRPPSPDRTRPARPEGERTHETR